MMSAIEPKMLEPSMAIRLLAREIKLISERLTNLETGIEALCAAKNPSHKDAIMHLQEIDILVQSSETLAAYAHSLSNKIGDDVPFDASELLCVVPLRDVAARLGGLNSEAPSTDFQLL